MKNLPIHIKISPTLYSKDPESSELGKKIVSKSIEMINELGFEAFTFRKLGAAIGSNESSVYRYFENKHVLLVYLLNWYWSWIEYKLVMLIVNVSNNEEKLTSAITLVTEKVKEDSDFSYINEMILSEIMITEASKAYHTKEVDADNKLGYFKTYKRVVQRISDLILAINPDYQYPHMLVSTVIEGAYQQRYFKRHLPSLTDAQVGEGYIVDFYVELVFKAIKE